MTQNSEGITPITLEERIIAKAMEDPAYKQRLLNDAKAVVEEELGEKLDEDITIQVLQQNAKHLYLVLPLNIDDLIHDGMISQEELEAVAGGKVFSRGGKSYSINPGNLTPNTRTLKNVESALKVSVAAVSTIVLSRRATTKP
ncbi:hypothetical protein A4S05_02675 [Nostoc sp. KVJ20]|uniref:NHLP leader peptide family RiPP precursor n=1 Tax=Nostoc sp. KVJ20 TaxID=457944 RepID=UPI00083DF411|nr:NHLP leader peptide family RiPP precursor [Nostoc sp. KVJ20]ODH02065.1 hypothetical protein A4S05_02675 [Nostoc sp. KVJ20]